MSGGPSSNPGLQAPGPSPPIPPEHLLVRQLAERWRHILGLRHRQDSGSKGAYSWQGWRPWRQERRKVDMKQAPRFEEWSWTLDKYYLIYNSEVLLWDFMGEKMEGLLRLCHLVRLLSFSDRAGMWPSVSLTSMTMMSPSYREVILMDVTPYFRKLSTSASNVFRTSVWSKWGELTTSRILMLTTFTQ